MATRDGARGHDQDIPNHGVPGVPLAGTPIARTGTPESSVAPAPARGIMFVRCCACSAQMPSVPVDLDDPANGQTSHGYCPPCERLVQAELEAMGPPEPPPEPIDGDGFVPEHDPDGCECPECCPDDSEEDLRGCGLDKVAGLVVLLIPWALLAAQAGGR